jgi:5,5'-dehydrodivanillate O-demethylase
MPEANGMNGSATADFVHTGPGTIAGAYLRRFWQPIYRAEDLQPGRAVPVRLMGEDFTLYRGDSGPHLLAFRCAHRGTQLSTGWVEGDNLRCFYHGWTYEPDGQCVEQPAEPEPFCQRIRIKGHAVEEYLGVIFAYIGDDVPPPLPRYPEFEEDGVLEVWPWQAQPQNFFQRLENNVDEVHIAFVHRDSWYGNNMDGYPLMHGEETDYGIRRSGSWTGAEDRVAHFVMPNVLIRSAQPGDSAAKNTRDAIQWTVPVDDEHFFSPMIYISRITGEEAERYRERVAVRRQGPTSGELGEPVLRGEQTTESIQGNVGAQDYVSQIGQGVIADRSQEHLGQSDAVVALMRSLWVRELRALAEGRPLKEWRRASERLAVTTGTAAG